MDTGTTESAPAPLPATASAVPTAPYISATQPNPREWLLLGLVLAGVLLALGLPWMFVAAANSSGLNFDTWKHLQPGAPLESFLPAGAHDYTDTTTGVIATYGDGVWAKVDVYDSQAAALAAWKQRWGSRTWPAGVIDAATHEGAGQWLSYAQTGDGRLIEWVNAKCTFQFFAPDDNGLRDLIIASPLIDAPAEHGYGHGMMPPSQRLLRAHAATLALVCDIVVIVFLFSVFWLRLFLLRVKPPPGARKVGRETLRSRLLGLNNANAPFVLEEQGPYHFIGRWKVDDPVHGPWLAGCNLRQAYQLDLYLEEHSAAGVLETTGQMSWDSRSGASRAGIVWNYLRSVSSSKPATAAGPEPESVILPVQSSVADDYREAVQQLVLGSGWIWKPMLFRPVVWEHK